MEFIIFFFIGGIILFVLMAGVAGWLGLGLAISGSNAQKKDEANADEILDRVFDGSSTVVHTPRDSKIGFDVLVKGATVRGYKLSHSEGPELARTHVFDKIDD